MQENNNYEKINHYNKINNYYNRINNLRNFNDNKTDSYKIILKDIDTSIFDEKNYLIEKLNKDLVYLDECIIEKKKHIEISNKLLEKKREINIIEYDKIKFPSSLIKLNEELKKLEKDKKYYMEDFYNIKKNYNRNKNIIYECKNNIFYYLNRQQESKNEEKIYYELIEKKKKKIEKDTLKNINKINTENSVQRKTKTGIIDRLEKNINKLTERYNKDKNNIEKKIQNKKNKIFSINDKIIKLEKQKRLNDINVNDKQLSILKLELENNNLEINTLIEESIYIDKKFVIESNNIEKNIIDKKEKLEKNIKNKNDEIAFCKNKYYLDMFKLRIKSVNIIIINNDSIKNIKKIEELIKEKDILCDELLKAQNSIEISIINVNKEISITKDNIKNNEDNTLKNYKYFSKHCEIDIYNLLYRIHKLKKSIIEMEKEKVNYNDIINIFNYSESIEELYLELEKVIKLGFDSNYFNILLLLINYSDMVNDFLCSN